MKKSSKKLKITKNRIVKNAKNKLKRRHKKHFFPTAFNNIQSIINSKKFYEKTCFTTIKISENFCLIRNYEESLKIIKLVSYLLFKTSYEEIYFDYSNCKYIGLDASAMLDIVVREGKNYRKIINKPLKLTGNYPASSEALQVFENSGLLKHLNISKKVKPWIIALDLFNNYQSPLEATNMVIEYYRGCLQAYYYQLTAAGVDYLNRLVGEVIDNMNNFCGRKNWYVTGHFLKKGNNLGKGSLTFISLGDSIYESFKNHDISADMQAKLSKIHSLHKADSKDEQYPEEISWTLLALQHRISSKNSVDDQDRGTGTVKFIEGFSKLGETFLEQKPLMAIISGNIHILFDGTYKLNNNVIAFNKENTLQKIPDKKYFEYSELNFPGTIVTTEFYVDKLYLEEIKGEKNEKN